MMAFMNQQVFYGLQMLRSSLFTVEGLMIPVADFLATGRVPRLPIANLPLLFRIRRSMMELFRADSQRIENGVYPPSVLTRSEPSAAPLSHFLRLPFLFREAFALSSRRARRNSKEFSPAAKAELKKLPPYYRRNFHFQKGGYLSEDSAELYDHQVELLFAGAADAMRRLAIAPLKKAFKNSRGRGLKFLEIGCGTGSTTLFLHLTFPEAEITAIDLSPAYLEKARTRLPSAKIQFHNQAGEDLSFPDASFDAVYSVFLFHELPLEVRRRVLAESQRVLKTKGTLVLVDSLQLGDQPGLDDSLKKFPANFHEPFYPNYIRHPMESLLAECGFRAPETELGFFSKMCAAMKSEAPRRRAKR